jgi:pimeloyl-ACP methyl ester carboxylesterase
MNTNLKVTNHQDELIDVLIEGNPNARKAAILIHGFGTDKHEHGLFDSTIYALAPNFLTIRFDFSGYGQSEGDQKEVNYQKQAKDLESIINWIDTQYPEKEKNIIAMSMGCYITAMLKPKDINKAVLLSIPNQDTHSLKVFIQQRISNKGGLVDEKSISIYPRTHGEDQQIDPSFWQVMQELDPIKEIKEYSNSTDMLIIHPQNDEIVASNHVQAYKEINTAKYLEVPGSHSYDKLSDRKNVIDVISKFLK